MKKIALHSGLFFTLVLACGVNANDHASVAETVPEAADDVRADETPENDVGARNQCGGSVERNLANLAGAAAEELGRWEASTDFQLSTDGLHLELSAAGTARCESGCPLISGILGLQRAEAATGDNVPAELAGAMVSGWKRQRALDGARTVDAHELTRIGTEPSQCEGTLFWFEADKANCSGECGLADPDELRHKLVFAGYPDNAYLEFQSALDFGGQRKAVVGIDPTYHLGLPYPQTCIPTCKAACIDISTTEPASCGLCCECMGYYGHFVRSSWSATTWVCEY